MFAHPVVLGEFKRTLTNKNSALLHRLYDCPSYPIALAMAVVMARSIRHCAELHGY